MNVEAKAKRTLMTRATAIAVSAALLATMTGPVSAQSGKTVKARPASSAPGVLRAQRATTDLTLSVGSGQLINLPAPISDVFVSNENVADVQVRSATQIYVFAKGAGESTVFATSRSGAVVYSANVRTGTNVNSIDSMLRLAMPDAQIQATPMNGMVLLTGTVAAPDDSAEAENLVQAFVGEQTRVISRLRTATPLQVNLQVRIAEVSRSLSKDIGVNLSTLDTTGGFQFGISQGRPGAVTLNPGGGGSFTGREGATTIGAFGNLLGLDIGSALDLAENQGLVTTLAQPNLTALSGETASFLAGGEFPILVSQDEGSVTVEYKQYGVSLAFTPTVLADGRISMRVRPEVSELSTEGAIRLNGFDVSGITTRRAETTVELGSGQSFMIGGLLRNTHSNTIERAPGLGNIPILGALFRSSRFRKSETELVIVVTPYLVKPTSGQMAMPTDGFRPATDAERVFMGKMESGKSGVKTPGPSMAPATTVPAPSTGAAAQPQPPEKARKKRQAAAATPGFSGL